MSYSLAAGATFVARGFAGDNKQETQLVMEGIKHKGFSIIDTMQPCVTFNHKNTFSWFYERVYKVEDNGHDTSDKAQAYLIAEEWPLKRALMDGEKEKLQQEYFTKKKDLRGKMVRHKFRVCLS